MSVSKFKKLATIATAAVSVSVLLTACQGKKSASSTGTKTTKHSIALITDNNAIDDHSFNEAAWNGFKSFGTSTKLPGMVSRPSVRSTV